MSIPHAMSRRSILRLLGLCASGAAFTLSGCESDEALNPAPGAAPDRIHTLIIGAGMAGLAAAQTLRAAGYSSLLLEARDRAGGRVLSSYDLAPHPVELGAEYLHGEYIITQDLIDKAGLRSLADHEGELFVYAGGRFLREEEAIEAGLYPDEEAIYEAVEAHIEAEEADLTLARLAEAEGVTAGTALYRLLDNYVASEYGGNLDEVGVYGLDELSYEGDGETDFHIQEGYGALLSTLSKGLNIRLNSPVKRVEWGDGVRVETATGERFEAWHVIITLPLAILQARDVEFIPALPDWKLAAIAGLGAGHVDKLILKFDAPFWPPDFAVLLTDLDSSMWWRPGMGREDEAPILTALIGGRAAQRFESLGEAEAIAEGLRDLEAAFGLSGLAQHLMEGRFIAWGSDPYSKMGYSYVPAGAVGLRERLAESIEDQLFFAGEATHPERAQTVHGAIESGQRAAEEVIDAG